MRSRNQMRADWDARARADAMHYIAFRPGDAPQDPAEFYRGGEQSAVGLVQPILQKLGIDPHGARILEIGCGMGRLFPGYRRLGFSDLWGIDISPEMVRRAAATCPVKDAHFLALDDEHLDDLPGGSFDYVVSYAVFQHIPDPDVIWNYLRGMRLLLRKGGAFQLHFMSPPDALYPIMHRMPEAVHKPISYVFEQLDAIRRRRKPERRAMPGGLTTWGGARLDPAEVQRRLLALGFSAVQILRDPAYPGGHSWWAIGRM